jgi:Rrf2 family protein
LERKILRIRRDIEYALIALLSMKDAERAMSTREVAEEFNIPLNLLRRIFHSLGNHGLIEASRGPKGGFRLKRKLEELSLQEVIEAIHGPVHLALCMEGEPCQQEEFCNIRHNMNVLQGLMGEFFSSLSVGQFARLQDGIDGSSFRKRYDRRQYSDEKTEGAVA